MRRFRRYIRLPAILLLAGAGLTIFVAWILSVSVDVRAGSPQSSEAVMGEWQWTVRRWDQPGATLVGSELTYGYSWSASQATGPPNTLSYGDSVTAWASATQDGQREWLVLEYAKPVSAKLVRVYETYCPGAIDRITVFDSTEAETQCWRGTDPTPQQSGGGISDFPLRGTPITQKIKLYINSPAVTGWNEIDAVGLISTTDEIQWARRATASSTYGAPPPGNTGFASANNLLPTFGDIERHRDDDILGNDQTTSRAIDGRGWPLPALWCERDLTTGAAIAGALGATHHARSPAVPISPTISPASNTTSYPIFTGSVSSPTPPPLLLPTLPIRIAWPGFFVDMTLYGIVLGALWFLLTRPFRLLVEVLRMRKGCCITCGYDLGYDFIRGCPECGWRRANKITETT